jgi:hypothetical protein
VKERRKEDLDVFKGRRLFVGVARVERFSGKVGWWLACLVRGGVTSGEGKPKQETARPGECRRILIQMMVTKTKLLIFALCLRLFLFSLARDMGSEVEGKG